MRKWRIGTLSMALTLIWLGLLLLWSQFWGTGAFDAFISWWPIVFVLLGAEVLAYLVVSRKQEERLQYDMLSVFLVGVLYLGCLGFTALTGTGMMEEIRQLVSETEHTGELPAVQENVADHIKRVVVQTGGQQVKIDVSAERSVYLFGTYRMKLAKEQPERMLSEDVFSIRTVGETMYVQVKPLPVNRGVRSYYPQMMLTAVLPQNVSIELRGAYNERLELAL